MKRDYAILAILTLVVATTLTLLKQDYYCEVILFTGLNILAAIGLSMLTGLAGQISLGHAGFYGLGAYISGVLSAHLNIPVIPAMVVSLVATALLAYAIGVPTLRLKGHYLAMGTLGFGIILYILFLQLRPITGGASGLAGIAPLSFGVWEPSTPKAYAFVVWTTVAAALALSINIIHSPAGMALKALHESEVAASTLGVDVASFKVRIFVLSAVFAALAGALYAHYITFISPETFGFIYSVKLVVMIVLGGINSLWGAVLGGSFLSLLPEVLHVFEDYEVVIYGAILLGVLIFFPKGLAGLFEYLFKGVKRCLPS